MAPSLNSLSVSRSEWMPYLHAAGACLLLMLLALAVGPWSGTIALVLFLGSYIAGMRYPLPEAVRELAAGKLDVDFLMLLVAAGAWALGHPAEGASLLVLFGASRAMEAYARKRTHNSLKELTAEFPQTAIRLTDNGREEIELDAIATGDRILVRPGDRIPVDGIVEEGESWLDQAALTGEAEPVGVRPGQEALSGSVNGPGLLTIRAARPSSDSAYQKVIQLVESAPARHSPAQVLSEQAGKYFTWAILGLSAGAFSVWWLAMGLELREAAYRAMVLLVAGSPCAIVLSVPSAILASIARGARRGILFNGGKGLSELASVTKAAFDKTGTLTTGEPRVAEVERCGGELGGRAEALALALAEASSHPASKAIASHLRSLGLDSRSHGISDLHEVPGNGVEGTWSGRRIHLGRAQAGSETTAGEYSRSVLHLEGRPQLRFHLHESLRPGVAGTLAQLKALGLSSMILSGDRQETVDALAREVGVEEAFGGLRPEEKFERIEAEFRRGSIMMAGDGVNDAPALAAAHVGVAMGLRGSAATLAQADIVLVRDRLADLPEAVRLSRLTRRIIRQNLVIAIGAAALLMFFALGGSLPLILGVFGHEGGTVLVVLNSLRLLGGRRPAGEGAAKGEQAMPSAPRKAENLAVNY